MKTKNFKKFVIAFIFVLLVVFSVFASIFLVKENRIEGIEVNFLIDFDKVITDRSVVNSRAISPIEISYESILELPEVEHTSELLLDSSDYYLIAKELLENNGVDILNYKMTNLDLGYSCSDYEYGPRVVEFQFERKTFSIDKKNLGYTNEIWNILFLKNNNIVTISSQSIYPFLGSIRWIHENPMGKTPEKIIDNFERKFGKLLHEESNSSCMMSISKASNGAIKDWFVTIYDDMGNIFQATTNIETGKFNELINAHK